MSPIETTRAFADAINRRDAKHLATWMTPDHVFVDSLRNRVQGKDKMEAGWAGYFRMVPDYSITVEDWFSSGDTVLMTGTAQGTWSKSGELLPENRCRCRPPGGPGFPAR
jgi:ketosteroid isomerase-like protein